MSPPKRRQKSDEENVELRYVDPNEDFVDVDELKEEDDLDAATAGQ